MKLFFTEPELKLNCNLIKESICDYKNIYFYEIDENKELHFLEPFLPLYINFFNNNKDVINFNLDITYSFYLKNNNIIKYKGYSVFPESKEYEVSQWKKCIIHKSKDDNYYKIKFKSFENNNEIEKNKKKLNIKSINNENDRKTIKKNGAIIFDDTITVKEDFSKDNLLINFQ